jgi:hypothetical protein
VLTLTHPERWARTITASHSVATRVEVWRDGTQLVADVPIASGTVTHDHGARITATATIEVADPSLLPVAQTDPLSPLGSSLRIFTGVRYPDGSEDLPQVFDGPIVSVPTWPGAAGSFTMTAEGWLRYVADDRFVDPYAPTSGASTTDELSLLLLDSVPTAVLDFDPAILDKPVTGGKVWEQERIDAVEYLAASLDAVVVDAPGGFRIMPWPIPDAAAAPLRTFKYGAEGAVLAGSIPELVREARYNGVIAYNPDDQSVRHLATIDDPDSPVRWGGPYGRRVAYYASPLLTAETVQQAAQTRLSTINGRMRAVEVSVLPDPSLEPGDHVAIWWPAPYRDPLGVPWQDRLLVRKVEHPLGPGATKLELRGTGVTG